MASSLGTTASASAASSSAANNASKSSAYLPFCHRHFSNSSSKVSFRINSKPKLRFSSKGLRPISNRPAVARAQLNEVADDGSSNASASAAKSEAPPAESKDVKTSSDPAPAVLFPEESVSAFMSQVASFMKLVDSKDIVELKLKQLDCELLIRKKEALPPPPSPAPSMMVPSYPAPPMISSPAPIVPSPAPVPTSSPTVKSAPSAAKPSTSSHPSLKCPMAGTFYRCPAPGEPPFVKVGDKVKKGQVVCIIEAMKLMNEIEADQSGTVVEVIAEDGKPVSVDTPLFAIAP